MLFRYFLILPVYLGMGLVLCAGQGRTQIYEGPAFSKQMSLGMRFFENGEDLKAMDAFMEVLVKGNPGERPMANEYLNLITQRMSLSGNAPLQRPSGVTVVEDVPGQIPMRIRPPEDVLDIDQPQAPLSGIQPRGLSRSDKEILQKEIEFKVRNRVRLALARIKKYEDIRVQMATAEAPRAMGIPTGLLFESGTQFKIDASKVLDALTELLFGLGATQVVLLPEGGILGDAKILDMRRSMAISARFFQAGIAPARVRVNLLNSQVDIPRGFEGFKGIVLLWLYNQPLILATESNIAEREGPPASLGAFPTEIDAEQGEGALIEFSVLEPPAGILSWTFQLVGPGKTPKEDWLIIQELRGSGPVFHQVYWNGRSNYFGPLLPSGRYQCSLTATDTRNRTRKKYTWITVQGRRQVEKAGPPEPVPGSARTIASKLKTSDRVAGSGRSKGTQKQVEAADERSVVTDSWSMPRKVAYVEIKKFSPKRRAKSVSKPAQPVKTEEAAPKETPQAAPVSQPSARGKAVNYQINFVKGAVNLTPEGENMLGRVADTMGYYPLDKIKLEGYAYSGEANPAALAAKRAELVFKLLVERYRKNPKQIQVQSQVLDNEVHKVEVYIVSGGE